jgi:hypothetical protein
MNIDKNAQLIQDELLKIDREGMASLVDWLFKQDFKTAPASTKYHLNVEGGLVAHSLNVLKFARIIDKETDAVTNWGSLTIAALLHDLCKVNFYELSWEWDKEHKDKTNEWRKKDVYKIKDQFPMGHGEKSVIVAQKFITLTDEEALAIRWHMAFSDQGVNSYPSQQAFNQSREQFPLVKIISMADQMAEMFETLK